MSEHNTTHLQELGRRRQKLVAQLADLDGELKPEIFAAARAGVPQKDIIKWTGMVRESVRLNSMTPEDRQKLRDRRKKDGSPGAK